MSKKVGDTYVNLGLKKNDFDAGLKRAKNSLRNYERDTLAVGRTLKTGFAALVSAGVVAGMKSTINAYAKQEKMERMLAAAMREKGIYTAQALKHNLEYASSLQRLTAYGDEEILRAQRIFTNYAIEGKMLDDLTRATLDLAAAKEMDLKSAADLVAKSVGSSTNALSRYGITVEGAAGSTARMESAVAGITKLYAGTAQAAVDNYEGQVAQLKNALGDTMEHLGSFFSIYARDVVSVSKEAVEAINEIIAAQKKLGAGDREAVLMREIELLEKKIAIHDPLSFLPGRAAKVNDLKAQLADLKTTLENLEEIESATSILEARRAAAAREAAAGAAPGGDDPYMDNIFAQAAGRRQRDADLDYQLWLGERERMAAESARKIARDDEMFAQFAARKREDVLLDEYTAYQTWLERNTEKTKTMSESMKDAITGWGAHFSSTLNDAVWDADVSFASIAESFGRMITQMMIQKAVVEPIMGAFFPSARGNVFARGEIVPFARGGVIDQPTIFPMAKGLGLMGEAGPEAVMPLARTSSGDLGVRAEGLAGAEPRVEVNVYAPAGSEARVEERQTAGGKVIDVIIDEMMAGQVRPGSRFDRAMRGRYGLAPATTRR